MKSYLSCLVILQPEKTAQNDWKIENQDIKHQNKQDPNTHLEHSANSIIID